MSYPIFHAGLIAASSRLTSLSRGVVFAVDLICNAIGIHASRHHATTAPVNALYARLRRTLNRLDALMRRFKVGHAMQRTVTRPAKRPTAARAPATRPHPLPTAPGWLPRLVPGAAEHTGHIAHLLDDADLHALAAASPQARRLLVPLWRMMGLTPPTVLDLPPPPKRPIRPRPIKPPPPAPEPPPPFHIQRFPDWPLPVPPAPD